MDFQPIIKWCGSKRIQSEEIITYFPKYMRTYYEPFCGGCSVLYQLMVSDEKFARDFVCSDINPDLINLWNTIKDDPDGLFNEYKRLWSELYKIDDKLSKREYFERIRAVFNKDRDPKLFFFLMRTCTNGMPRYNKHKEFNTSFHLTRDGINPIRLKPVLMNWSELLNENEVTFKCCDYKEIIEEVEEGDLLYLDPPFANDRNFMHFGKFNHEDFFNQLRILCAREQSYVLSFDGRSSDNHKVPYDCYENHVYINSKNASYRKTVDKLTNEDVFENLYWN